MEVLSVTTYAKITARFPAEGGGAVRKTVTLEIVSDTDALLTGYQVDKEGERLTTNGAERYIVIGKKHDILKRVDLRMNLHYGELEPIGGEQR